MFIHYIFAFVNGGHCMLMCVNYLISALNLVIMGVIFLILNREILTKFTIEDSLHLRVTSPSFVISESCKLDPLAAPFVS